MVYFPRRIVACACVDADTSDHRDIVIVSAFLIISIGTLKRERDASLTENNDQSGETSTSDSDSG